MDINLCRKGQRYLFYDRQRNIKFRACFLDIIRYTLRVTEYEKEGYHFPMGGTLSMPLGWIEKVETLETIVDGDLLIPSEIMIEID
jgi:hypothetical protein